MKRFLRNTSIIFLCLFAINIQLYSQIDDYFTLYAEGFVNMLIVDGNGRRLGFDPITETYFNQIPSSSIGSADIGNIDDYGDPIENILRSPIDGIIGDVVEGTYQIILTGEKFSTYSLNFRYDTLDLMVVDGGILGLSQINTFYLTLHRSPNLVFKLEKIITPSILRQDLNNCYALNLLGTSTYYTQLSNILTNFEQRLAAQDSVTARQYLLQFRQKIEAEINDTTNMTSEFIDGEAWGILDYDAQYLLDRLPIWKPKNLQSSFTTLQTVAVTWTADNSPTMLPNGGGYDLYRALCYDDSAALPFTKLNSSLLTVLSFTDSITLPTGIPANKNVTLRYYAVAKNVVFERIRNNFSAT
jgi:hypothetical protein